MRNDRAGDGDPDQAPRAQHRRYLDLDEIKALLAAPDRSSWLGRRDHALLLLMIQTGVRVSELAGLRISDVNLGAGAHIQVTGKGRKKRATTLTSETVTVLRRWLAERGASPPTPCSQPARDGHSAATRSAW